MDEPTNNPIERLVPVLVWFITVMAVVFIPINIITQGYLPVDDALRHAAKVVSGKTWPEILVMRQDLTLDHNPGWHVVLGAVYRATQWSPEVLAAFSVVVLMVLFCGTPLTWLRRPEAWLTALLAGIVASRLLMARLSLGRPLLLTSAVLMFLLALWAGPEAKTISRRKIVLSVLAITASVWMHGSWYLFALLILPFLLVQEWQKARWLGACWGMGTVLGAMLTGHPFEFLKQALHILFGAIGSQVQQRALVIEFRPLDGEISVVLAIVAILLWRSQLGCWHVRAIYNPIFMLVVISWILGFKVMRFWLDWGLPAALVWISFECQDFYASLLGFHSVKRLMIAVLLAMAVFLSATADLGGRWTQSLDNTYLTQEDKDLEGWLPEAGGILYTADMTIFYQTFFSNPQAPWRYILGFEPALMPEEDLQTYRNIQLSFGTPESYDPWLKKMRPQDRLVERGLAAKKPLLPRLEWLYKSGIWIGRLPRG